MMPTTYEIRKSGSSTYPWWVHRIDDDGKSWAVRGSKTKKEATLIMDIFTSVSRDGLLKSAATWYRYAWERAVKKDPSTAKSSMTIACVAFGFGPSEVNADPNTGIPY